MDLRPEIVSELWNHGLLKTEDCTLQDCQELYQQVLDGEPLPADVWQIGDTARFVRLKDGVPSPEEIQQLLQFRQIKLLKSIRSMVMFFFVLTLVALGLGLVILLSNM